MLIDPNKVYLTVNGIQVGPFKGYSSSSGQMYACLKTNNVFEANGKHAFISSMDINFVSDLEKLKKTFDDIGVHYVEEEDDGYVYLYLSTKTEQINKKLNKFSSREIFFEFCGGKLASHP